MLDLQSIKTTLHDTKVKFSEVKHDLEMATGSKPRQLPFPKVAIKANEQASCLSDIESQKQNINMLYRATYAFESISDMREACGYSKIVNQAIKTGGPIADLIDQLLDYAEKGISSGLDTIKDMLETIKQAEKVSTHAQNGLAQILNLFTCGLLDLQTQPIEVRISQYEEVIHSIEALTVKLSKPEGTIFAEQELHTARKLIRASARLLYKDYQSFSDKEVGNAVTVNKAVQKFKAAL